MRLWRSSAVPALLATVAMGCHELQPHRLQRMNRGGGLSPEAYYSVRDPDVHSRDSESRPWASPVAASDSDGGHQPIRPLLPEPAGDLASE
jgi:hypothetical protein